MKLANEGKRETHFLASRAENESTQSLGVFSQQPLCVCVFCRHRNRKPSRSLLAGMPGQVDGFHTIGPIHRRHCSRKEKQSEERVKKKQTLQR